MFKGISAVNRSEQVREQLLRAIERGDFKPGDALPSERILAELLRVSRVSIREAIRSLEAIGLLNVKQGRGTFVANPGLDEETASSWLDLYRTEVMDLLAVRGAIDQIVAEGAARHADRDALQRIQDANERYVAGISDPTTPIEKLVELDILFHESVAEASGNPLAMHLLRDLNRHLHESRRLALLPEGRPERAGREHTDLVEAILEGNPMQAKVAALRHVEAVRVLLDNDKANGVSEGG